jgi:chromosome segregation ATPase
MPRSMSEERLALALDRLESALARLDAAGAALQEGAVREAAARESLQAQLANLDARHRRLRASAATAIEQIDGLIAPGDGAAAAAEAKDG